MAFNGIVVAGGSNQWEELTEPSSSPEIIFSRTDRRITRYFKVPSTTISQFTLECFPSATGSWPGQHPIWLYLFVDEVRLAPFGAAASTYFESTTGIMEPEEYLATVTYTPLETQGRSGNASEPDPVDPEQPGGGTVVDYLTGSVSFSTEAMTLPGYGLEWQISGNFIKGADVNFSLVIPITQFTLLVPRVPAVPWAKIRSNRGKVNKNEWWGADPETVLYTGAVVSYRFSSDGTRQFDVEHHFSEKSINWGGTIYGWNHLFNTETNKFDRPLAFDASGLFTDEERMMYRQTPSFSDLIN